MFGVADYAASTQARTTNIGGANEDYSVLTDPGDDGMRQRHWGDQWHFALSRMVVACRAYGSGRSTGRSGLLGRGGLPAAARRAAQLGCEGKWAIHPSQIALANEVFSPSDAEVEHARRILEAMEQAAGREGRRLPGRQADRRGVDQDGREPGRPRRADGSARVADDPRFAEGLALLREGRGFEAHELFEDLWREADPGERDFYQGLVHVAVSLHLERRGSLTGMRSQLGKARRRLAPYARRTWVWTSRPSAPGATAHWRPAAATASRRCNKGSDPVVTGATQPRGQTPLLRPRTRTTAMSAARRRPARPPAGSRGAPPPCRSASSCAGSRRPGGARAAPRGRGR